MDTPKITNPEEALAAQQILARPHSVPRGHLQKSDLRPPHNEVVSPSPARLDLDKSWHILGMLYSIVGLDRSAFELLAATADQEIAVTTYEAPAALYEVEDMPVDQRWARTIQGIDLTHHRQFIEHLASYEFRRPKGVCNVRSTTIRLPDPFAVQRTYVPVTVWLPERPGRKAQLQPSSPSNVRMLVRFVDAT